MWYNAIRPDGVWRRVSQQRNAHDCGAFVAMKAHEGHIVPSHACSLGGDAEYYEQLPDDDGPLHCSAPLSGDKRVARSSRPVNFISLLEA